MAELSTDRQDTGQEDKSLTAFAAGKTVKEVRMTTNEMLVIFTDGTMLITSRPANSYFGEVTTWRVYEKGASIGK